MGSVSGIKQHIRLMHPDAWASKAEAVDRCTSLGLRVETPCAYCHLVVKDPRTHIRRCSVLFQASLCALLCVQDHDSGSRKSGCHHGAAGDERRHGFAKSGLAERELLEEAMEAEGLGRRARTEAGDGRWSKWQKPQGKGGWSWGSNQKTSQFDQFRDQTLSLKVDSRLLSLLVLPVPLVRHEEELSKIRIDTTFFVYLDTGSGSILPLVRQSAEVWNQQCEEGKVTTPLRIVLFMLIFKELQNASRSS